MNNDLDIFEQHDFLMNVQTEMLKYEQLEIPVIHTFSGGVYIREIFIPKGTLLMGERHRGECCNILIKGEVSIYNCEDRSVNRIKGPLLFTSPPGTKKFGYCHEDAIFMTIHPTEKTDIKEIEKELIIPEEEYMEQIKMEDESCLLL